MRVRDGYPSSFQYQKEFGTRKWNEILEEIGIQPNNALWRSKEERFLKNNWISLTDEEIALELGKTVSGVKYKRQELGLFRQSQKQVWQVWEINFLNENFFDGEEDWICEMLSHRKWETIRAYATKTLKLRRKNKLYKYQLENGKRICKKCNEVFEESEEYFYHDGNGYRTLCITCYNEEQENKAREQGVLTRKLIREKFDEGYSYCGRCKEWKNVHEFRRNHNDLNQLHRWCEDCEVKYLREYHLKKKYGDNYEEMHFEINQHKFDINGDKWDSMDERDIANWLIINNFQFGRGPYYKDVFDESSRRRFDWSVSINGQKCLVEYFGRWDIQSDSKQFVDYTKKAKKKIRKLYKNRESINFIVIFPNDLKNKELSDIFSLNSVLN